MKEWNTPTIRMANARRLLSATLVPDMGGRASSRRQKKTALASPESEDPAASDRIVRRFPVLTTAMCRRARTYAWRRERWCPGAELNHRHLHFQCSALPTELPGRRARPTADDESAGFIKARFPAVQTR